MSNKSSPIASALALKPNWYLRVWEFDALAIHPCRTIRHGALGADVVEACEPPQADFWSVVGHSRSGGADEIGTFSTEAEALACHDRLISIYPHLLACNRRGAHANYQAETALDDWDRIEQCEEDAAARELQHRLHSLHTAGRCGPKCPWCDPNRNDLIPF